MKGVILAFASFIFFVTLSLVFLRVYRGKKFFKVFILASLISLIFYSFTYFNLSADLEFLAPSMIERHKWFDYFFGLITFLLTVHIFWDVSYATVLTGFSSHLMILIDRPSGLSLKEILQIYGANEEIDPILSWRLANLKKGNYLREEGRYFQLLGRGKKVAMLAEFLKRLYRVESR